MNPDDIQDGVAYEVWYTSDQVTAKSRAAVMMPWNPNGSIAAIVRGPHIRVSKLASLMPDQFIRPWSEVEEEQAVLSRQAKAILDSARPATRTVVVEGVEFDDDEYGTVFVDMDVFEHLAYENDDPWGEGDDVCDPTIARVLVKAGLARRRTRGSIYGTPEIHDFYLSLEATS